MGYIFDQSNSLSGAYQERVNADGSVDVYAKAITSCTSGGNWASVRAIVYGADGYAAKDMFEATASGITNKLGLKVGVPKDNIASGSFGWFQTGGYASLTNPTATTLAAGESIKISGTAAFKLDVATTSVINANTFAINTEATTSYVAKCILLNRWMTTFTG